jgi:hypothetical protein
MRTLAQSTLLDSEFGSVNELPHAGSALENPYVYDAAARELKQIAEAGGIEILAEQSRQVSDDLLICHLRFRRTPLASSTRPRVADL